MGMGKVHLTHEDTHYESPGISNLSKSLGGLLLEDPHEEHTLYES